MLRDSAADGSAATMKALLDTIDKVRASLSGLKDNSFYEELLSSLPQFVVCGPQSAGKSSVIRRISGISLPEASTLCTRMATLVQLRRSDETMIRVTLVGPSGEELTVDTCNAPEQVREAVSKAQETALARSPGKTFVDDHSIQIYVSGPAKANVTLVDLPGFHTADDLSTRVVNEMVQRYIGMQGTLVLHVIKGDQDYASMLGNDFMRHASKHDGNRVTVLTHCDKLDSSTPGDVQRLQTTLDTTQGISSRTYAVHGSATADEDEQQALTSLAGMDHRVDVGASQLAAHLEERMQIHLEQQYPKAVDKLEKSLASTMARLDVIKEKAPVQVLFEMTQKINDNYREEKGKLMNELRSTLEQMTSDIKNFQVRPVTPMDDSRIRPRDNFDEPLEKGQKVWYDKKKDNGVDCFTVVAINGGTITLKDMSEGGTLDVSQDKLYSNEMSTPQTMVDDIIELIKDRGIRNSLHADRQPIIHSYASQFADHYTDVISKVARGIGKTVGDFFDRIFAENLPEISHPAAARLRRLLRAEELEAMTEALASVASMKAHNMESDLIFSPNEHYLNELLQQMVAADKSMASDQGGARHMYHNVRAYIKVQRKFISELASKEMIRTLAIGNETRFRKLLALEVAQLTELVNEPSKIVRERESLINRKQVLESALQQVPSYWMARKSTADGSLKR